MKKFIIPIFLFLVGCSNPGIVRLSPDTYMLFREDHAGVFGSPSSLKAGVITDANQFAEKKGKVAIPISSSFKPMGTGPAQWATFEYQFRVVDFDDPEVKRVSLKPRANVVVEKRENITANIKTEEIKKEKKDLYSELIKLSDLREKGILTEEEFNILKSKMLTN